MKSRTGSAEGSRVRCVVDVSTGVGTGSVANGATCRGISSRPVWLGARPAALANGGLAVEADVPDLSDTPAAVLSHARSEGSTNLASNALISGIRESLHPSSLNPANHDLDLRLRTRNADAGLIGMIKIAVDRPCSAEAVNATIEGQHPLCRAYGPLAGWHSA